MSAPLLPAVAVILVLIGLRLAFRPVPAGHAAALGQRHGLPMTPGNEAFVLAYLSVTRRWRVTGILGGALVCVVWSLPQGRVAVELFPVIAGWFAGAAVGEFRFRPPLNAGGESGGAVVPAWLRRAPVFLAAATAVVTALTLPGSLWWGAGGLACAAMLAAVDRHVLGRAAGEAGDAVAAQAVNTITALGGLLVVWCLASEVATFTAPWSGGIAVVWVVGGVVAAWLLATRATRATRETRATGAARSRPLLLVAALVVVTSAGWAGFSWWKAHPPYPAGAVQATATLRLTDHGRFTRDAAEMGITELTALVDQAHSQQFIGRVDHAVPAGADRRDTYHVLVIDKRQNRLAPELFNADGGGWNGFMSGLADRYDWLSATADIETDGGFRSPGSEVNTPADVTEPITFVGRFPDTAGLSAADLMVVLVLSGPDNQIYWATRISGPARS